MKNMDILDDEAQCTSVPADHVAAYDASVDDTDGGREEFSYGFTEDLSLWCRFKLPCLGNIRFNPIVSFLAIVLIWGFVAWCIVEGEDVAFNEGKTWVVDVFTWLYVGSQDFWAFFMIVLYFSKYGNLKLGKKDEKPEYNDVSWFVMLFACGIGVGLFFYGVAEPIYHYTGRNRYTADPTTPDNTLAQIAINITLFHWGIHAWIVYTIIGMILGMMTYREGLPMTMKSCFYPLIGDRIFGWLGDLIDVISIMTTVFGVCTSLGLGTKQLNFGFHMFNPAIPNDDITVQLITIWLITAVATLSTMSGVGMGIRRLSEICFAVGMFIMLTSFFLDDTWYLLNVFTQSIGYYIQWIMQLGWHTDAFEMLGPGITEGRFVPDGFAPPDGGENWMDGWTIFYWGWWISWSPFVGMFIAKISRGRTIREFINGTMTAPCLYSFMWLCLFGGAGIKMERTAFHAGLCCPDANGWFVNTSMINSTITDLGISLDTEVNYTGGALCNNEDGSGSCGPCASKVFKRYDEANETYGKMLDDYMLLKGDFGSSSADRTMARVSCHQSEQMWFDLMRSYAGGIGDFMCVVSLIGLILYFVTSSDSGSLVVDCMASNGDPEPPRVQRVFWALTEGGTATALLVAGGSSGLSALQSASITAGLPYTFMICIICVALWRACQVASGDLDPHGPAFAIGLFDALAVHPYRMLYKLPICRLFGKALLNVIAAPIMIAIVAARVYKSNKVWAYAIPSCIFFVAFIVLHIVEIWAPGCWAIAWFFWVGFSTMLTAVRVEVRTQHAINGNAIEDFFACLIFYPLAILQMDITTDEELSASLSTNNFFTPQTTRPHISHAETPMNKDLRMAQYPRMADYEQKAVVKEAPLSDSNGNVEVPPTYVECLDERQGQDNPAYSVRSNSVRL